MSPKKQLMYLLEKYYQGEYETLTFANEFSRIYDLEMDYSLLSHNEHDLMKELSIITGRYSPFEQDLKIPNAFFNENDVKAKATEVYLKLIGQ